MIAVSLLLPHCRPRGSFPIPSCSMSQAQLFMCLYHVATIHPTSHTTCHLPLTPLLCYVCRRSLHYPQCCPSHPHVHVLHSLPRMPRPRLSYCSRFRRSTYSSSGRVTHSGHDVHCASPSVQSLAVTRCSSMLGHMAPPLAT